MLTNQETTKINQLHLSWTLITFQTDWEFTLREIDRASNIVDVAVFIHEPGGNCDTITELCQCAAERGMMPCLVDRGKTDSEKISLITDCYPWLIFYMTDGKMMEVNYTGDLGDNEWVELREIGD